MKMQKTKGIIKSLVKSTQNKFFPKKTYAQHQEDIVLLELFDRIETFIDIGANDGISCSNTYLLALQGANGLCFEPVKLNYTFLKWLYVFNNKVKCIQEGISNEVKQLEIQRDGLLSFIPETRDLKLEGILNQYFSKTVEKEIISVKPLNYWLDIYTEFINCDVLSLDVEGHELYTLQSIDFSIFKTKCFVIETYGHVHRDYDLINTLLNQHGYQALLENDLNTFWFARELVVQSSFVEKVNAIPKKFSEYKLMYELDYCQH
ncbi:hypothetical protein DSM106972_081360 [Dulcicalothrix desertica PCC 7102]|uniref:Methyltransferase FkbM domain-containing protein n=1 Tax=Dulcicalothrix desertica PCC 7102 TaxID=232991 RepID=A0A3S1C8S1_9CYAN|nr:FkbM family methyltransferase [Dulcicalothrix desertica]RUS98507.1 hypothetical protein DSM106972_081360 [Dulcicalothrix desertica PCC 7102]TWH54911.1 FkbM family methyltransferase [Dulcicalothrix desertica PCC 7102]